MYLQEEQTIPQRMLQLVLSSNFESPFPEHKHSPIPYVGLLTELLQTPPLKLPRVHNRLQYVVKMPTDEPHCFKRQLGSMVLLPSTPVASPTTVSTGEGNFIGGTISSSGSVGTSGTTSSPIEESPQLAPILIAIKAQIANSCMVALYKMSCADVLTGLSALNNL